MDAGRFGPIGASLFVGGAAYRLLGDRTIKFSATSGIVAAGNRSEQLKPSGQPWPRLFGRRLPEDTYTADWSFEADPWLFRVGVGLRFSWLGFGG